MIYKNDNVPGSVIDEYVTGHYDELRVCLKCDECGEVIYEGDTFYHLGDSFYCEYCYNNACEEIAEYEED